MDTQLGLTVIDFEVLIKEIEQNFKNEQPLLFQEIINLSLKDRKNLYLLYTLNTVISVLNREDYKKVVFYVNTTKPLPAIILECVDIISNYFPVVVCKGTHDVNCLKENTGEKDELIMSIHGCRYEKDFSLYTERRRQEFFSKYKALKGFQKFNAAY